MAKLGRVGSKKEEEQEVAEPVEEVPVMQAPPKAEPKAKSEAEGIIESAIAKVLEGEETVYTKQAVAKLRAAQVLLRVG